MALNESNKGIITESTTTESHQGERMTSTHDNVVRSVLGGHREIGTKGDGNTCDHIGGTN